jgi:hypothetical protein
VLALSDLETPEARAELRHAAAVLEQFIARRQKPDAAARRRRLLA